MDHHPHMESNTLLVHPPTSKWAWVRTPLGVGCATILSVMAIVALLSQPADSSSLLTMAAPTQQVHTHTSKTLDAQRGVPQRVAGVPAQPMANGQRNVAASSSVRTQASARGSILASEATSMDTTTMMVESNTALPHNSASLLAMMAVPMALVMGLAAWMRSGSSPANPVLSALLWENAGTRQLSRFAMMAVDGNDGEVPKAPVDESDEAPVVPAPVQKKANVVSDKSVLVVGATGTLGRQVVRQLLSDGYNVRCLVKPRPMPADFLRDWGAQTVQGDLTDPTSLPPTLVGVHTIIDCASSRPEEPIDKVDWEGKVALIKCAQAIGIQRYVFMSIYNADKHPEVPLMNIKSCTEKYLAASGLNYTIFRLCGFMQAVIPNYAVPILEEKDVFGTDSKAKTAYMNTIDIARLIVKSLTTEKAIGQTLIMGGPDSYTISEVIEMCEKYAGGGGADGDIRANVKKIPVWLIQGAKACLGGFQWFQNASDRLAFAEVMEESQYVDADMKKTYEILDVDPSEITRLDNYISEFYDRILKKLKEVGGQSRQTDFYI